MLYEGIYVQPQVNDNIRFILYVRQKEPASERAKELVPQHSRVFIQDVENLAEKPPNLKGTPTLVSIPYPHISAVFTGTAALERLKDMIGEMRRQTSYLKFPFRERNEALAAQYDSSLPSQADGLPAWIQQSTSTQSHGVSVGGGGAAWHPQPHLQPQAQPARLQQPQQPVPAPSAPLPPPQPTLHAQAAQAAAPVPPVLHSLSTSTAPTAPAAASDALQVSGVDLSQVTLAMPLLTSDSTSTAAAPPPTPPPPFSGMTARARRGVALAPIPPPNLDNKLMCELPPDRPSATALPQPQPPTAPVLQVADRQLQSQPQPQPQSILFPHAAEPLPTPAALQAAAAKHYAPGSGFETGPAQLLHAPALAGPLLDLQSAWPDDSEPVLQPAS